MKIKSTAIGPWATLAIAGAAQFLVLLESTIITVAIPPIGAALGDQGWLAWVLSGYLLAFGGFLLPGGVWADRIGSKRVFLISLIAFAVTSVACAAAPSISLLVGARGLQGAAAGVLAASALGLVLAHYEEQRERAIAMTVWSALGVVGAVVGSLVAGPVIAWFGWQGVFWVNVVAVVALLPFAFTAVQHTKVRGSLASSWPAVVAAGGAAVMLAGLSVAESRFVFGVLLVAFGIALVAGTVLIQGRAASPILPVGLFRQVSYRKAATGLFFGNGLMIATMFAYSAHLQEHYGLSATVASFSIVPMSLAAFITAFAGDILIARLSEARTFRLAAGSLVLGATVLLTVAVSGGPWGWLIIGGLLIGAGLPASFIILNRWAFVQVASSQAGVASGFTNMVTTLGGAVVVAMTALSATLFGQLGAYGVLVISALIMMVLSLTGPGGLTADE